MLSIQVDFSDLEEQLDGIKERTGHALRYAVYEGAKIIREEAERRAPMSKKTHIFRTGHKDAETHKMKWDGHKYLYNPGDLKRSIYIAFAKDHSIDNTIINYDISFRKNTAYGVQGQSVPYAYWQELGRALEYGGAKRPAHPFLRPAFDARREET